MSAAAEYSLIDGASGIIGTFSVAGDGDIFEAVSASFDLLVGVKTLPSALWLAKTGEEAWPLLRCLFDGMPRAEAKLLAIEELMSRGGR